jgi:AcrR family transcriptional regulator
MTEAKAYMNKGENTKQHILEFAKAEFLEKGYNDASVRNIAKTAGLTTGAIFRYFPDKESIFTALVSPVADAMFSMYQKGNQQGFACLNEGHPKDMWGISDEIRCRMVEYIFSNKDTFALLINCSAGSCYEHFVDEFIAEEEKQSIAYLAAMKEKGFSYADISAQNIHVLLSAEYYAVFETVRHDMSKEETLKCIRLIADFFRHGWQKIYGV